MKDTLTPPDRRVIRRGKGGVPMQAEWAKLATFDSGFDADVARTRLEEEDIPVLVRGDQTGHFGPSFGGRVPGGIEMYVPSPELERARELLNDSPD